MNKKGKPLTVRRGGVAILRIGRRGLGAADIRCTGYPATPCSASPSSPDGGTPAFAPLCGDVSGLRLADRRTRGVPGVCPFGLDLKCGIRTRYRMINHHLL